MLIADLKQREEAGNAIGKRRVSRLRRRVFELVRTNGSAGHCSEGEDKLSAAAHCSCAWESLFALTEFPLSAEFFPCWQSASSAIRLRSSALAFDSPTPGSSAPATLANGAAGHCSERRGRAALILSRAQRGQWSIFYRLTAHRADRIFWFMLTIRITGTKLKAAPKRDLRCEWRIGAFAHPGQALLVSGDEARAAANDI
jgi:hypothetical protein